MPSLPCCTLCEGVHPQSLGATPRWVVTETTVFVSCEDYDPVTYNEPITFHCDYSDHSDHFSPAILTIPASSPSKEVLQRSFDR